ncbi:hypothetical protein [Candidatus Poriferisodalis sp.]|uniref:hypothetical protein n=1 Tax=Candidatus Poriferisodalis sp. TaxID=3101277 RepID=UPI003B02C934
MKVATERVRLMYGHGASVLDDLATDIEAGVDWVGIGPRVETGRFEHAREEIEALLSQHQRNSNPRAATATAKLDDDQLEGKATVHVFDAVEASQAAPSALDDPGFWRYLALAHLWNFAAWRERRAFTAVPDDSGTLTVPKNLGDYVDGKRQAVCVPLRMFLRVRCLGGTSHAGLASAVRQGTDFWRSHILRVVAGEHPTIVRAMVRRQADESTRLNTGSVREFAKELNRTLVNVVPAMLDDDAADELVGELWQRHLNTQQST